MHSIFILRLFNDCIAMLLAYIATGTEILLPITFDAARLALCCHACLMRHGAFNELENAFVLQDSPLRGNTAVHDECG